MKTTKKMINYGMNGEKQFEIYTIINGSDDPELKEKLIECATRRFLGEYEEDDVEDFINHLGEGFCYVDDNLKYEVRLTSLANVIINNVNEDKVNVNEGREVIYVDTDYDLVSVINAKEHNLDWRLVYLTGLQTVIKYEHTDRYKHSSDVGQMMFTFDYGDNKLKYIVFFTHTECLYEFDNNVYNTLKEECEKEINKIRPYYASYLAAYKLYKDICLGAYRLKDNCLLAVVKSKDKKYVCNVNPFEKDNLKIGDLVIIDEENVTCEFRGYIDTKEYRLPISKYLLSYMYGKREIVSIEDRGEDDLDIGDNNRLKELLDRNTITELKDLEDFFSSKVKYAGGDDNEVIDYTLTEVKEDVEIDDDAAKKSKKVTLRTYLLKDVIYYLLQKPYVNGIRFVSKDKTVNITMIDCKHLLHNLYLRQGRYDEVIDNELSMNFVGAENMLYRGILIKDNKPESSIDRKDGSVVLRSIQDYNAFRFMHEMKLNLARFYQPFVSNYATVKKEIENERKNSHYMWYMFPQLKGLGFSKTSYYYGMKGKEEAKAFYNDIYVGELFKQLVETLLKTKSDDAIAIFGEVDAKKLHSSMTLFYLATKDELFKKVLDKFFDGELDKKTVELLK